MLEALDMIDWSQLKTCYGNPEEIPIALRNLASKDAMVRGQAGGTLHMELAHQGTIYEAAIYAIPFLLEFLTRAEAREKRWLVKLLANLGSKGAYLGEMFENLAARFRWKDIAEGKGHMPPVSREERNYYGMVLEKTHQAVREGFPLFLPLLADDDPAICMNIAYLFTFFPEDTSWLSPLVIARLEEEQDEYVISCLLLCLGYLRSAEPEVASLLRQYLLDGKTDLLRFVAAMALCLLLQEKTPVEAVHVLLAVLADPYPLEPAYEALPGEWGGCWVHMRALLYLDKLISSSHQTLIMEGLMAAFPFMDERVDQDCADVLLRVAFYEKGFQFYRKVYGDVEPPVSFNFADLDPTQQHILRLLAAKETLWEEPSWRRLPEGWHSEGWRRNPAPIRLEALAHLRLPPTLQELQSFITLADHQ